MATRIVRPSLPGLLCLALALAGCGGGGGDSAAGPAAREPGAKPAAAATINFSVDDAAVGPAPAIPGAVPGGTIRGLNVSDVAHLDPARVYVTTYNLVTNLISRTLTGYQQVGDKVTLVGDLATNTGVTKDGGKTWTYTLRDGITWEDGSPITSADMKYGIERTFVADYAEGPVYLQEWLTGRSDFRKVYPGPYGGKSLKAISTPDAKTLVMRFPKPTPDVPFAMALASGAPVKKSADTRAKYDQRPFASGPYKIESHKIDKSLTLVRNTAWKAESDPIHYQYPDRYDLQFGDQRLAQYQRLIAGNGADAAAVPLHDSVASEVLAQIAGNPELSGRTVSGYTPFVFSFNINTRRLTDVEVRKALLFALPKQQLRQIEGGPALGDLATTISAPTLVGHEAFDLYNLPPEGDPQRARATLQAAGKLGQKVVYGYENTDTQSKLAIAIAQAWTAAGFEVVKKPLSSKNYFDQIGKLDNGLDVYLTGWGFDWPSGSTVYPPQLDGRKIAEQATNYDQFDNAALNAGIDRNLAITDPVAAGKAWAAFDREVMALVPQMPFLYDKILELAGPKVGNAQLDRILGTINLNGLFVKP